MTDSSPPQVRPPPHLRLPGRVRGVIFDGDDTLWMTEPLYDDARAGARRVVEWAGLDGAAWEAAQRSLDVENVAAFGHGVERFPTSAVQALDAVGGAALADHEAVRAKVWDAASTVFVTPAPLRPDAVEVLDHLSRRGVRLGLLTKGDPQVQRLRIEHSGLAPFFDPVCVVDQKTAESFTVVAQRFGFDAGQIVSVGNSVGSDIRPSVEAGIYALWIPAHVWEYERHDPTIEAELHRIDSLPGLLEVIAA